MQDYTSRYFELLRERFPTRFDAACEIALAEQTLTLPRPTEIYLSDIHGEYESFAYILRSGCNQLQTLIDDIFHDELSSEEKACLANLVIYPEEKSSYELSRATDENAWYVSTLSYLSAVLSHIQMNVPTKALYAALPNQSTKIIETLLLGNTEALVQSLIETNSIQDVINDIAHAISSLVVGKVHLVGDVYDRGPAPDLIMDEIADYDNLDIQWGNHDVVWMGAALGQRGCIAHVVRNCARYANLSILSDAYGINLLPLITFAQKAYKDDPCVGYALKGTYDLPEEEIELNVKVQKAMAILQFKVEAHLIDENPSYGLEDRKLLHTINREKGTIVVDGVEYEITDMEFPTVDWNDPYKLTDDEETVMRSLESSFMQCKKLQRHIQIFLDKGSLYHIENNTLMYHACVPLNTDGSLKEVDIYGNTYKGKALFDAVDYYVCQAFTAQDPIDQKKGRDLLWYLWLGEGSPLFAKSKMATFEIYLIADKAARKEVKNSYYSLLEDKNVLAGIFEDFGMDPERSRIVCGHTPVKVKDGESPIKCDGLALIIDGGFSRAYQSTTGIAGFTLVSDPCGTTLFTHDPFDGKEAAISHNARVHSSKSLLDRTECDQTIADTDLGEALNQYIDDIRVMIGLPQIKTNLSEELPDG